MKKSESHYRITHFAEVSKFFSLDTDLRIILLDHQNNYIGRSSIMNYTAKSFDILAISLSVLHNYFNGLAKLFLDLHF